MKLASGAHSVHSLAHHETFHPVVGPAAEAEALYVRQLGLRGRLRRHRGGVRPSGMSAWVRRPIPITVLRAARGLPASCRILSFDHTLEPLRFALGHTEHLPYLSGWETIIESLLSERHAAFRQGALEVSWDVRLADFPHLLTEPAARTFCKPHTILFDAFSPAKNPAMWTLPVFTGLFGLLDPARPCAMPTYSRSTMLRVTLLLAGFFVGVGQATGQKRETAIAANTPSLIAEPLDRRWLDRACRSTSAEPMRQPVYHQSPLSAESRETLAAHPQFAA